MSALVDSEALNLETINLLQQKYLLQQEKYHLLLETFIVCVQMQAVQQGVHESLHRDMMIGFGKWEFDPMELQNPFPSNEGSVHLWQGDDDKLVPVVLQRYIAEKLPWIHYHELPGYGHLYPFADGMSEAIARAF